MLCFCLSLLEWPGFRRSLPRGSTSYLAALLPITIITTLTFAYALYSIVQARKENGSYRTTFNASNTLHLIMASAAGSLPLEDFNHCGIINNEDVKVQLVESKNDYGMKKRFVIADQWDSMVDGEAHVVIGTVGL
jgi:hypothetical protein